MEKPVKVAAVLVLPSSFPVHLAQRLSSDVAPPGSRSQRSTRGTTNVPTGDPVTTVLRTLRNYIGGEYLAAADGQTIEISSTR